MGVVFYSWGKHLTQIQNRAKRERFGKTKQFQTTESNITEGVKWKGIGVGWRGWNIILMRIEANISNEAIDQYKYKCVGQG